MLDQIATEDAVEIIRRHTIGDGYPFVVSLDSHMSRLIDEKNNVWYIDCVSQYASQPLGWNHPALGVLDKDAPKLIKHKIANPDFYTKEKARFVRDIADVLPDFKYFFFVEGGSLAVENALKVAFDWKAQKIGCPPTITPDFDVVHLKHAFHGRSGYTLSLTNTTPDKTMWFPTFKWTRVDPPAVNLYPDPDEQLAVEERVLREIWHAMTSRTVAAFIMEPIQGEGGDNYFTPRFFKMLREMCDELEVLLIFDEVQTGVGITGKMWAYQHYGVVPDIISFGKKTQVCGIAATGRIEDVNHVFKASSRINSTWGGNIVDMVRFSAIKYAIEQENMLESVNKVGEHLRSRLKEMPLIKNVRGLGLMVAFDMEDAAQRDAMLEAMEKNYLLALKCGPKSIRLRPHLTFSLSDANTACEAISKAITCIRPSVSAE
jgi:L-lysine 6-transaminase